MLHASLSTRHYPTPANETKHHTVHFFEALTVIFFLNIFFLHYIYIYIYIYIYKLNFDEHLHLVKRARIEVEDETKIFGYMVALFSSFSFLHIYRKMKLKNIFLQ